MTKMIMKSGDFLNFKKFCDDRGFLISLEENKNIPFNIKRVYYLCDLSDKARGFHSHLELKQVIICLAGSFRLTLEDASGRRSYILNKANVGVFVGPSTWREMSDFSVGTVIIVLASEVYDEEDYIRNYDEFKRSL